jgi:diguanylate cyclase (GGDEF)-like protein
VVVVLAVAGITRAVAVRPTIGIAVVGTASLAAVAAGIRLHGGSHRAYWRQAWILLAAGLFAYVARAVFATVGFVDPMHVESVAVVGGVASCAGVLLLLNERVPGRTIDILFQGLIGALALASLVWVLSAGVTSAANDSPLPKLIALTVPMLDLVILWLLTRLVLLSDEHPVAYRFLMAGFVVLLSVHGASAAGALGGIAMAGDVLYAFELWAFCLWSAAAMHPSLGAKFEPVPLQPVRLGWGHFALVASTVSVTPLAAIVGFLRDRPVRLPLVLVASTVLSIIVVAYLIRQVRERASGEYRAHHDALTGLPSSVLYADRLVVALAHARRSGKRVGVMYLDLDRFKNVNDSLGHHLGNELLQAVAKRLSGCLREQDTVARLGGDEFAILLSDVTGLEDCVAVAKKVLAAFDDPFTLGGRTLMTSTSIGIALFPDDGAAADLLLKNADTAMYRAKSRGRGTYQLYTPDMSARARVKLSLESSLHSAIERNELQLYYQPKIDYRDGRLVGAEALARWRHPKLGFIAPGAFIRLAEESGLILPLGEWAMRTACEQARAWQKAGLLEVPVAVNLSARQFAHERVEGLVERVLRETGLDPALLELELTESVFVRDVTATGTSLNRLRALGVRCSIDDFGTGFSALNYLVRMPIDSLKVDRSFVQSIDMENGSFPLVGAVIALAHSLNMNVVAEGVETVAQAQFLAQHGCYLMQGYLFGRPMAPMDFERWVRDHTWGQRPGQPERAAQRPDSPAPLFPESYGIHAPDADVAELLLAVCADDENGQLDPRTLHLVLDALQPRTVAADDDSWPHRWVSNRVAAGTLAGLLPLSGGLIAAGALPEPAQTVTAAVLAQLGLDVPAPDHVEDDPSKRHPGTARLAQSEGPGGPEGGLTPGRPLDPESAGWLLLAARHLVATNGEPPPVQAAVDDQQSGPVVTPADAPAGSPLVVPTAPSPEVAGLKPRPRVDVAPTASEQPPAVADSPPPGQAVAGTGPDGDEDAGSRQESKDVGKAEKPPVDAEPTEESTEPSPTPDPAPPPDPPAPGPPEGGPEPGPPADRPPVPRGQGSSWQGPGPPPWHGSPPPIQPPGHANGDENGDAEDVVAPHVEPDKGASGKSGDAKPSSRGIEGRGRTWPSRPTDGKES